MGGHIVHTPWRVWRRGVLGLAAGILAVCALAKAHCRLGTLHQPAHQDGALYVSVQGAPAGKRLAHNARVALWVGAKRASLRGEVHR